MDEKINDDASALLWAILKKFNNPLGFKDMFNIQLKKIEKKNKNIENMVKNYKLS